MPIAKSCSFKTKPIGRQHSKGSQYFAVMVHGSVGCSLIIKILEQCLMNWWSRLILFMSLVDIDKRILLILLMKMAMLWYLGLSGDKDFRTVQGQRHLHWHLAKVPRRYRAHLFALFSPRTSFSSHLLSAHSGCPFVHLVRDATMKAFLPFEQTQRYYENWMFLGAKIISLFQYCLIFGGNAKWQARELIIL